MLRCKFPGIEPDHAFFTDGIGIPFEMKNFLKIIKVDV